MELEFSGGDFVRAKELIIAQGPIHGFVIDLNIGEEGEALGWMVENRHLRAALRARAEAGKAIDLRYKSRSIATDYGLHGVTVTLDSGNVLRAPVLVAAEGRNSPTREAAGIRIARWRYDHRAIVCVSGSNCRPGVAASRTRHFRDERAPVGK